MKQSPNRTHFKPEDGGDTFLLQLPDYNVASRHNKNIAVLRSTIHFRSTEYKHNVITYLHQNTQTTAVFSSNQTAQRMRIKQQCTIKIR